jgi:hypothetical protein
MAGSVPFVLDEEDQDDPANDVYSGPQRDANDDDADTGAQPSGPAGKLGPSGSGKGDDGRSAMPGQSATVSADPDEQALVAPKYTAPDRTALNAATSKLTTDSAPIKAADYKPKWYERLLGGVAGGLSHDAEGGSAVTNRRLIGAKNQQSANVAADTTAIQGEQGKIAASDQDFERSEQGLRGQVSAANANSLTGERQAKAEKYDAAIDPNSIHENKDGDWEGTTYGGKVVPTGQPRWATPKPAPTPKTYEELKEAANDPQYTPEQRAGFAKSAKEIEGTEVKKFQATAPRPSAEELEYGDWKKAFQRDNGRAPTAQELEAHKASTRSAAGTGKSQRSIDDAAAKAYKSLEGDIADGVVSDPKQIQKKKQDIEDQRHQDMLDIGQTGHTRFVYDDANKGHNEAPQQAGRPTPGGAAPAKIVAPKSGHQLQVGQQVNVPGKGLRYVTGYVNGKVQVDTKPPQRPGA